jgi:hypothetical protein
MSQAGILSVSSSSGASTFVTDSGSATPSGGVINVVTPGSGTQGVKTTGAGNTITVTVNPTEIKGAVTTTGVQTLALITVPLGAIPGVYTFDITVAGFATSGIGSPLGAGFTIVGSVRTTGAAATLIPTQAVDHFEEGALTAATALLGVSGNNAVINVTGVSDGAAGFVIDWTGFLVYTFAS